MTDTPAGVQCPRAGVTTKVGDPDAAGREPVQIPSGRHAQHTGGCGRNTSGTDTGRYRPHRNPDEHWDASLTTRSTLHTDDSMMGLKSPSTRSVSRAAARGVLALPTDEIPLSHQDTKVNRGYKLDFGGGVEAETEMRRVSDSSCASRDSGLGVSPFSPTARDAHFFLGGESIPEEECDGHRFDAEEEYDDDVWDSPAPNRSQRDTGQGRSVHGAVASASASASREIPMPSTAPIDIPAALGATMRSEASSGAGLRYPTSSSFMISPPQMEVCGSLDRYTQMASLERGMASMYGAEGRMRCSSMVVDQGASPTPWHPLGRGRDRSNSAPVLTNREITEREFGKELQRIGDDFHDYKRQGRGGVPGRRRHASSFSDSSRQLPRSPSFWERFQGWLGTPNNSPR